MRYFEMMFKTTCPKCEADSVALEKMLMPDDYGDIEFDCPNCGNKIVVHWEMDVFCYVVDEIGAATPRPVNGKIWVDWANIDEIVPGEEEEEEEEKDTSAVSILPN